MKIICYRHYNQVVSDVKQTRWCDFTSHVLLTKNHSKGRVNIDNDRSICAWYLEGVESTFEQQTERLKYRHGYHLEMEQYISIAIWWRAM